MSGNLSIVRHRSPEAVLLLSVVTCSLYLPFWYYAMYQEVEELSGEQVTSTGYWVDLLLVVFTCGLYGIWVDYRFAQILSNLAKKHGVTDHADNATIVVVLDVAAYFTAMLTNVITSAIQQGQLNKIVATLKGAQA